jgi:tight adherence protein B
MATTILFVGLGLAFLFLVIGLVVSVSDERSLVDERLGRYLEDEAYIKEATAADRSAPFTEWLTTQAARFTWGENLAKELARADIKLRVGEYLGVMVIVAFGGAVIFWLVGGRSIPIALIGAIIGLFIPRYYVSREQSRRLIRFDDQLADMLNLMVNGLRAGYSTMQAMEAVSKELPAPISDEFRRVVQEMQLGLPMEHSMDNLMRRIPSRDLDLVVTAINVQREVGGNLAEVLSTISHTIRERVRVKGEIRVMVSQVMMSGKFLAVMPILLSLIMYFLNRPYMMLFFDPKTRWLGIPMLIVGVVMISLGYFTMRKMADIEV